MGKKKFISIILARGGSKGLKNKNLKRIAGKPLIEWSIIHSLRSKEISSTWVSSDSKKILNFAKKKGARIILRPKKFASDIATSESAWIHAIKHLKSRYLKFNYVVGMQPTSPIRLSGEIDKSINFFKKKRFDSLLTVVKTHNFTWVKKGGRYMPDYKLNKRKRRQNLKPKFLENGSFYIFGKDGIIKHTNRLYGKIGLFKMNSQSFIQVDDLESFNIVNYLMKN